MLAIIQLNRELIDLEGNRHSQVGGEFEFNDDGHAVAHTPFGDVVLPREWVGPTIILPVETDWANYTLAPHILRLN